MLLHPIPKQPWELTYDKVTLINKIGAGAFGEVWRGCIHESPSSPPIDVAVKMKKVTEKNKAEIDELYKEARLMRQYKHKNVVAFYGVVIKGSDSAMIVMEFIDGGSLKDYLKKNRSTTVKAKLGYAIDVAVGLVYLHSKTCMHRDVACRNCLIDVKKKIVKISDFGLSKQAESYHIPASEKLAIKWFVRSVVFNRNFFGITRFRQGPEVILKHFYTLKSDVYSYGICLWEIFNNGDTPYKGIRLKEIKKKVGYYLFHKIFLK
ncbi:unnamed protein product [Heligmosomoides polygyrus]|uniref:Protein kinase domain-containing protein n=1 Tax=Heligmosomoides polygyrus TaxID=6339 RepID=A0A183FQY2_HELPZ|nr:unnamed protein product [Heligmosomoides polygyrus]